MRHRPRPNRICRLQVNEAHPPRASDLAELQSLQKTRKDRGELCSLPLQMKTSLLLHTKTDLKRCVSLTASSRTADVDVYTSRLPCRLPDDTDTTASLSETLKSKSREAGPRVVVREPKHLYMPQSPRSRAAAEAEQTDLIKEMFHEMGDIGLKPVVVYHNLR